jgi:predicted O-linked N-acetylglucosamine transferase (SPINDLY family)
MLLGRDDLIAATLDEYVEIAVALAHDSGRRQELRVNIQKEFRASPAMNGPSFARKLEQIFREMVAAGAT